MKIKIGFPFSLKEKKKIVYILLFVVCGAVLLLGGGIHKKAENAAGDCGEDYTVSCDCQQ